MAKTRPETQAVKLTYDELETALIALAIRQEELREARSREAGNELEMIWHVSDKMDVAQRRLESRMTDQLEGWLASLERPRRGARRRPARPERESGEAAREPLMTRLSRLLRL